VEFENDLRKLKLELKLDKDLHKDLYNALCNMRWKNKKNPNKVFSCSWRYAGSLIADLLGYGNYLDHYNSGKEGIVTAKVEELLNNLGWEKYPFMEEEKSEKST